MTSVASEWESFAAAVLLEHASEVQVREMRRAFYAGVWSALCEFQRIGEPDVSEADGVEALSAWVAECERFKDSVLAGRA